VNNNITDHLKMSFFNKINDVMIVNIFRLDWIEQGLTSHQTHYRSYWGQVLWVKWPNQQCQSTERRLVLRIRL